VFAVDAALLNEPQIKATQEMLWL